MLTLVHPNDPTNLSAEILNTFSLAFIELANSDCHVLSSFQTNFGVLKSAMSSGIFRIDEDYMPFGRLSKDTLEKARDVLREIK